MSARVDHDDPFSPFDETPRWGLGSRPCVPPPDALMVAPVPGEFRHRVGLHRIDASEWIAVDDDHQPTLAMKEHLLATRPDEVFAALPGTDAAGEELVAVVAAHLRHDHGLAPPDAPVDGVAHGLDRAGRMVADDLCLLDVRDGELVLVGGSLCSPNRWLLTEKLGQAMDVVHGPVPLYERHIATPVDHALSRLTEERLVARANWGVADHAALFQPAINFHTVTFRSVEEAVLGLWLRVERQTLRRLPESGAVVFTIRTYQQRLADYLARPAARDGFQLAIEQLPAAVATYKGVAPYLHLLRRM